MPTLDIDMPREVVVDNSASLAYERDRRNREERTRSEALLKLCGVPTRYLGADLSKVSGLPEGVAEHYTGAVNRVEALWNGCGILALVGPRGVGKTYMACGLVLDFCRHARAARYLHVQDYFEGMKATYDDDAKKNEGNYETDYLRPELLVLDEMHERGDTAWEDRKLTRLIVKRHDMQLRTILLSNDNAETFCQRVGDSIVNRMREDAGGIVVCDWKTLRGV